MMRIWFVAVACSLVGLTGCAGGAFSGTGGEQTQTLVTGAKLTGVVHGGQNPISAAHVYLLEAVSGASGAGATAYGGNGIAPSASNMSVSLLNGGAGTTTILDQSGGPTNGDYYVATGSDGSFTITGDYTCTPGQQVYLYALGGDPGLGTGVNPAAGLMAVLGSCPTGGNFLSGSSPISYVLVNEVSTVAAAYAMAGFASDAVHVGSSGTAPALTGIANAFANAANLETLTTGVALASTPAGNGTAPQATINTLANVLAACVNSNGTGSACSTLFANAESAGATGTAPTDTATAAINIAHNPAATVAALYGVVSGTPPFAPGLIRQPNDFTIALNYSGGGMDEPSGLGVDSEGNVWVASYASVASLFSPLGKPAFSSGITGSGLSASYGLAVDGNGDAWIPNQPNPGFKGNSLSVFNSSGESVAGSTGFTGGGLYYPIAVAIDTDGSAWAANYGDASVTHLSGSGTAYSGSGGYTSPLLAFPDGIAIDGNHNVWVSDQSPPKNSPQIVVKVSPDGSQFTSYPCGDGPAGLAVDQAGNMWIANYYGNSVSELNSSGADLSNGGYTGGGIDHPLGIAIDGAGNVWVSNYRSSYITELAGAKSATPGAALSPSNGFGIDTDLLEAYAIAVDASGDVWISNFATNTLTQFVGAAAPVKTPLSGLPALP